MSKKLPRGWKEPRHEKNDRSRKQKRCNHSGAGGGGNAGGTAAGAACGTCTGIAFVGEALCAAPDAKKTKSTLPQRAKYAFIVLTRQDLVVITDEQPFG